jgi:hypothetical protein
MNQANNPNQGGQQGGSGKPDQHNQQPGQGGGQQGGGHGKPGQQGGPSKAVATASPVSRAANDSNRDVTPALHRRGSLSGIAMTISRRSKRSQRD